MPVPGRTCRRFAIQSRPYRPPIMFLSHRTEAVPNGASRSVIGLGLLMARALRRGWAVRGHASSFANLLAHSPRGVVAARPDRRYAGDSHTERADLSSLAVVSGRGYRHLYALRSLRDAERFSRGAAPPRS